MLWVVRPLTPLTHTSNTQKNTQKKVGAEGTALMEAAAYGHSEAVAYLMNECAADVSITWVRCLCVVFVCLCCGVCCVFVHVCVYCACMCF